MIFSCSRAADLTAYQLEFRRFRYNHRAGRFVSNQSQAAIVFKVVYSRPDVNCLRDWELLTYLFGKGFCPAESLNRERVAMVLA